MRKFTAIAAIAVLAACSQAEEEAAPAPESTAEDVTSHVGAAIVTMPDGSRRLSYSTADGKAYGALMPDGPNATWAADGDKACITPPAEEKFCITYGPVADDGSVPVMADDGSMLGSFVPFGDPLQPGSTYPIGPGSDIATPADGDPFLSVWTRDGQAYRADNPQEGTWRSVDGKRCGVGPGETEESCSTPGPVGPDGTFEATADDGTVVKVQFLD